MLKFLFWRLVQFPLIIAIIYLITFVLVWIAPGTPFDPGNDRKLDPVALEQLQKQFHADHWYKFLSWYPWRLLQGDLGPSLMYHGWTVNDVVRYSLPVSVTLGMFGMTIALLVGAFIGALAAVKTRRVLRLCEFGRGAVGS